SQLGLATKVARQPGCAPSREPSSGWTTSNGVELGFSPCLVARRLRAQGRPRSGRSARAAPSRVPDPGESAQHFRPIERAPGPRAVRQERWLVEVADFL